ncbi:MAG TPA: DUF2520 domain-containing protein [Bacteroidales bacterium]|nr:DUF2520 domain-containing protein [Bacteroidales bacterium]
MPEIKNIVVIGAGNVGTRMAMAFQEAGCRIAQVAGRREAAVRDLASRSGAAQTLDFGNVLKHQDLYLLALPDKAMKEILPNLGLSDELLVHTSGSVPMEVLSDYSVNTGVFYPLQTFSTNRQVDMKEVPILIEANRIDNEDRLLSLAHKLSRKVSVADSKRRQRIHIAAVFASNFSNHMYVLARKLMEGNDFDYDMLAPLIKETASKALEMGPDNAQTGPAKREDDEIITQHLELLKDDPALQEMYRLITKSIINQNKA